MYSLKSPATLIGITLRNRYRKVKELYQDKQFLYETSNLHIILEAQHMKSHARPRIPNASTAGPINAPQDPSKHLLMTVRLVPVSWPLAFYNIVLTSIGYIHVSH